MPDAPDATSPSRWRNPISGAGLICGLLALGVALLPAWVAPLYDPPVKPFQQRAAEWLRQLGEQATGGPDVATGSEGDTGGGNPWRSPRLTLAASLLAFAALVCAAVAFVRREEPRAVACGVALAAGAIASEHLLTSILVLAFAITAATLARLARRG
jgi:hypothetical protein